MKIFEFIDGKLPILVSMPHNGSAIPDDIASTMNDYAVASIDTDWFMDRIYEFATDMGCHMLIPHYSRYVIDLNRPESNESLYPGADTTELCPTTQFDRRPIYRPDLKPDNSEITRRIEIFWRPYHQRLRESISELKRQYGYLLLFEAHSIKSVVPRFFDGQLADFNFGNYDGQSSSSELSELVKNWQPQGYSKVFNERFKGGYITREYGRPEHNIDSLQLELSQATYMDESSLSFDLEKAASVVPVIESLFKKLEQFSLERTKLAKL